MKNAIAWWALIVASGCLKAPEIVVVDRATALEEQAGGSFDELERKLARAALAPRPVPFTPEELDALGVRRTELTGGVELTDADRVDRLLVQRCLGEARDGVLVQTPDACLGAVDLDQAQRLLEATNRARTQLWHWMHEERPALSVEQMQRSWRDAHAHGVVCGAWMQRDDGKWEAKKC